MPLAELRERLLALRRPPPLGLIEALECDSRGGARSLGAILRARRARAGSESLRLRGLFRFERQLWKRGASRVAGVDEAGVGPLAGPVVAAAVILPRGCRLPGLNDSKKIASAEKREELAAKIKERALSWALGRAEVGEIDTHNIYQASLMAMYRAVEALKVRPDHILVDARTIPCCPIEQSPIVHGDALSASIAASSILAKTERDAFMTEIDRRFPGWGFAVHKGYPTPDHCRLLRERGPAPVHRRSFLLVRQALGWTPVQRDLFPAD